jgi:hypothetical protein
VQTIAHVRTTSALIFALDRVDLMRNVTFKITLLFASVEVDLQEMLSRAATKLWSQLNRRDKTIHAINVAKILTVKMANVFV